MKFSINSKTLLSRLVAAGKAINNRPTISILANFLFSLEGKVLTIVASDSDHTIVSRIAVNDDVEGSGSVCIDAKRVTELLKAMPDCPVSFSVNENTMEVNIRYTNGKYNLAGVKGEEYPINDKMDESEIVGVIEMPASQVLSAMDKVAFAVASDELRPQFNGILWDIAEDSITFVATDTRVLAKYRSTQTAPGIKTEFVLPSRVFPLIRAVIGKQASVKLTIGKRCVALEGEDYKVQTTLLQGRYPDYNRVIPVNPSIQINVNHDDFANAITRVSICADAQNSMLRLKISANAIDASAQDYNYNMGGEERISCECEGGDIEIGFNSSYLKGVLNTITTQNMIIKLSEASKPGLFLPAENDEYGELTLLCMPISLSNA